MKKRLLSSILCAALLASVFPAAVSADEPQTPEVTGSIVATVRFDYPQRLSKVNEKNISVKLYKDNTLLEEFPLNGNSIGDIGENVSLIAKNADNADMSAESEENEVGSFDLELSALPLGTYNFEFAGDGYLTYKTPDIELKDSSKHVVVGTSGAFSIGDVNGDNKVDTKDRDLITEALGKTDNDTLAVYDLNGDDKINIIDLVYVNHQINADPEVDIHDSVAIAINQVKLDTLEEQVKVADGTLSDMFLENNTNPVTIAPKDNEPEISIPIEFKNTIEMEEIEVVSPEGDHAITAGNAVVTYEDEKGHEVTEEIPFDYSIPEGIELLSATEGTKSVVISLGKRVAVKKVTIHVTKVEGDDGAPKYVVVQEIKFLKEILSENPAPQVLTVKNVKAEAKNEAIRLTWNVFPNISGYKVYYGEQSNALTKEMTVDVNSAVVGGLKNLKTYYFAVAPISEDWEGGRSQIISAMPMPSSAPKKPDMVTVSPMDSALAVSWKKTENATYYKVFYKENTPSASYKQFGDKITATNVNIGSLTNGTEYLIYVVAGNDIGVGPRSLEVAGIPEKIEVTAPKIPTLNQISNDNIKEIKMAAPSNVLKSEYPNGFSVSNVADGDYGTHWTARAFWESNTFTFTFKEAKEMNYMVYVPRLDGKYRRSLEKYSITVWDENGTQKNLVTNKTIPINSTTTGFMILPFEKTTVSKLSVTVNQWAGSPTGVSLAEVVFYQSDNLEEDVRALFANDAYTELSAEAKADKTATMAKIESLRAQANDAEGYYVDKDVLLDELNLAEGLLNGNTDALGYVKVGAESRRSGADSSKYGQSGSDFQPLGVVAYSTNYATKNKFKDKNVTVYASIPEGQTAYIVATQYFAEANTWQSGAIPIRNGRNIIEIPNIGAQTSERGGALYLKYSGTNPEDISLQFRQGTTKIPYLELSDWYSISETERRARISDYVDDLTEHTKKYNMTTTGIYNSTEISLPNVLLSVPAAKVLSGITTTGADKDYSINALYNNTLAWEDLMHVVNTTQGIDNTLEKSDMQSRQNIRYMRMFGGAFMYAAGSHIGIGYGSVSGTVSGKPISALQSGSTSNKLFGWGIAHEIGHNMDKLGKAEITNNIYSLMAQTYDGKANTLPSRLEKSNKYPKIYEKVAAGRPGMSNDVFVQLGMYWQLHLAYDDGDEPMAFYNSFFKEWKSGKISASSSDEKFALVASKTANKNLTEFFESWGMRLSDSTKATLSQYPEETRSIQYLNDNSRRYRLNGGAAGNGTTTANAVVDSENEKQVNLTFSNNSESGSVLGYEIKRNGVKIAFVTDESYTDVIGSANNKTFTYTVQAFDMLGNKIGAPANAGQIRISYVQTVDKNSYTMTKNDGVITAVMKDQTPVSGIKVTNAPSTGEYTVTIKRVDTDEETGESSEVTNVAKNGSFENNETPDAGYFVAYFNKPGAASDDTRIWTYDADEITITGIPDSATVEFISYAGDNIAFNDDAVIGRLSEDYKYGDSEDEVIKAGTLIITGTYRGDPVYNTIQIDGRFISVDPEADPETSEQIIEERAIAGYSLLFAEIPADGEVSDISDGIFIFVPDVQREAELQETDCECSATSLLPAQIKASIYRTDTATDSSSKRLTSDTIWVDSSSDDSMPTIILE